MKTMILDSAVSGTQGNPKDWAISQRGSVLLFGLIVSLLVLFVSVAAITMTITMGKDAQFGLDRTRALSIADGTTEAAQKQMLDEVANFKPPSLSGSVTIGASSYPFSISAVGSPFSLTDADGINREIQHYKVSASVSVGDGYASVDRIVDLTATPLFQFMIFYNDDLEILPGPSMTLGGRVHSNKSIYVGCGNTLTVDSDYFRCTGDILRKRKDDNSEATGTVNIKEMGGTTYDPMDNSHDARYPAWVTYALDTWKGTVEDGAQGVKAVSVPKLGTLSAFNSDGTKGYYHANADLVLRDGAAYDKSGSPVSLPPGTISEKTLYDAREGKTVTVTEVNFLLLNLSGMFPANGLIYAYRTDSTTSQPNGIRLTNGTLLAKAMTLVSEDPVYVQGDFNTVEKKGAAVICDAVNLLSNNWNDTKSSTSGLPVASDSTYNLAFVTGNVPTPGGGGSYSGGFENLPRFHENWTGKTATIRGSFIKIFESQKAKSPWRYGGNVYTAPTRDWQYDPALNSMGNLPPFTPSAIYVQRVLWDDRLPMPFGG